MRKTQESVLTGVGPHPDGAAGFGDGVGARGTGP